MAAQLKIRVILADDEAPARARIRQLLKDAPDCELVAECGNGREAVESVRREQPDLLFLDVQMPRLNGLEVCQSLSADSVPLPLVIFVTAYDQFALKAFEIHALDYLLKPFDRARFQSALTHAREQLRKAHTGAVDPRMAALLQDLKAGSKKPERLVFKQNGRLILIEREAIDWIEAEGNYVRIHVGPEAHFIRETLTALETQLPAEKFLRISRSLIVNLDRVKEFQPLFYGDYTVVLRDGSKLAMSRGYRARLDAVLQQKT